MQQFRSTPSMLSFTNRLPLLQVDRNGFRTHGGQEENHGFFHDLGKTLPPAPATPRFSSLLFASSFNCWYCGSNFSKNFRAALSLARILPPRLLPRRAGGPRSALPD